MAGETPALNCFIDRFSPIQKDTSTYSGKVLKIRIVNFFLYKGLTGKVKEKIIRRADLISRGKGRAWFSPKKCFFQGKNSIRQSRLSLRLTRKA